MGSLKFLNRKSRQFVKSFSSLHCFKFSQFTGYGHCYVSCMCGQGKWVSNDWILDRFDIPVPPITTWQLYVCLMWTSLTDTVKEKKAKEIHTVLATLSLKVQNQNLQFVLSAAQPEAPDPTALVWFVSLLISGVINLPHQSTVQVLTA